MSAIHFHQLTVTEVRKETADCVSVVFSIPTELQSLYNYKPGQYLTLRKIIGNEDCRRSYSISSSPYQPELRIAIKQVSGGLFSTYANTELKPNDVLDVMPPQGNFTIPIDVQHKKNYVAFAAGSGITPILSILTSVLAQEPFSTFTLIYGNKTVSSILFKEEIEALKNRYLTRFQVIHILSREYTENELSNGHINAEKCHHIFDKLVSLSQSDMFFICGPEAMIQSVKQFLILNKIDESRIKTELFTPSKRGGSTWQALHQQPEEKKSSVTIKLDDRTTNIQLAYSGQSILDAALMSGADLPYACKGGVCCTCRAKLIKGEVDMEVNYSLEKDEVEQGFILTCQAHPKTDEVIIDFDIR